MTQQPANNASDDASVPGDGTTNPDTTNPGATSPHPASPCAGTPASRGGELPPDESQSANPDNAAVADVFSLDDAVLDPDWLGEDPDVPDWLIDPPDWLEDAGEAA